MAKVLENTNIIDADIAATVNNTKTTVTEDVGPSVIEVNNLVKRYTSAPSPALAGISFKVKAGEIFGLLGPNGAGKTTTIGILTTRIRPTSGQAFVANLDVSRDPASVKKNIAVVVQRPNLDGSLNARENLIFHAAYFGVPRAIREKRADELLAQLGLADWKKRKLEHFSGGMLQRVMIARALMTEPLVLFLDEPTTGLDPQSRLFLWDTITAANKRGMTVILTTHNMDEADQLCHHVGIIDHGQLLALDTPNVLKNMVPGGSRLEVQIAPCSQVTLETFVHFLQTVPAIEQVEVLGLSPKNQVQEDGATIRLYTSLQDLSGEIVDVAHRAEVRIRELRLCKPSLENLFIFLTGRELRA